MVEEELTNIKNEVVEAQEEKPNEVALSSEQLLDKINDAKTNQDIKDLTTLFNLNLAKSEMIRALKQNDLMNVVLKQAAERLEKRPGELSTKDLIDYMNVFQANLNRANDIVEKVNTQPAIQINQHKDVIINIGDLSRDSRENVLEAFKELIKDASIEDIKNMANANSSDIIDGCVTEEGDINND